MSNHDDEPLTLDAQCEAAFELHASALAARILSSATRANDVVARFEAMQLQIGQLVLTAACDWNRAHDFMRVLPFELRETCWSQLPLRDIARLALVCSAWRDLSRSMPALWTSLVVRDKGDLDMILALSGQLQFTVSIWVAQPDGLRYVDKCMGRHALRLRSLRIDSVHYPFDKNDKFQLFRYPVPVLERLSLEIGDSASKAFVNAGMFCKCAPELRSVTLYDAHFPSWCPAFRRVTELAIIGRRTREPMSIDLGSLFLVAPSIEKLELANVTCSGLPTVPASSRLSNVKIYGHWFPFQHLVDRGYLGLRSLVVRMHGHAEILAAALEHHPEPFHAALSIHWNGETAVDLRRAEGASAHFSASRLHQQVPLALLDAPVITRRLAELTLPSNPAFMTTGPGTGPGLTRTYPLLSGTRVLPILRSLTISLVPDMHVKWDILDSSVVRGTLVAPALERIAIVSAHASVVDVASPALVNPGQLYEFIAQHVTCNAPHALELLIDMNSGIVIDTDGDAMELLRAAVGNLVM